MRIPLVYYAVLLGAALRVAHVRLSVLLSVRLVLRFSRNRKSVETSNLSLEVSIKTYIDCILYIDCSICFTIVHMVAFVNLILKKMMNE